MTAGITIDSVVSEITRAATGKYDVRVNDQYCLALKGLASDKAVNCAVVRLKRNSNEGNYWKTIALNIVDDLNDFKTSFEWVAALKEELLDPESADLYFIGGVKNPNVSAESLNNIEAGEQFCRKYIFKPEETVAVLLERTFLGNLSSDQTKPDEIVDPLFTAILDTAKKIPEFDIAQQRHWRSALLSGNSGADLIDLLFKEIDKPQDNEAHDTSGENNPK